MAPPLPAPFPLDELPMNELRETETESALIAAPAPSLLFARNTESITVTEPGTMIPPDLPSRTVRPLIVMAEARLP